MSFDQARAAGPQRIAIVGGGVSGLATAWLLSSTHHVTLFESAPRLGGHARTVLAGKRGDQPVDTGFIVFNHATYPHFTRFLADLDVPTIPSEMSFGVTIDGGRVEYGLKDIRAILGQKRNVLRPSYVRMLLDILRFHDRAEDSATTDQMTIDELLDQLGLGEWFRDYYLLPICGAIWSTSPDRIGAFPARTMVGFFRNHGLLSATKQHRWWTVRGGSIEYVRRLEARLRGRGCELRTSAPVSAVWRNESGAFVAIPGAEPQQFDQVILACHSDQAHRLITDGTVEERRILLAIRYQDNRAVLHRDTAQMPRRRACWSSWVYQADTTRAERSLGVTYWMNRLQAIPDDDPLFVTLNPFAEISDHLIHDDVTFRHPVFDAAAIAAQRDLAAIQGRNRTWFAGAWTRFGFHEDGFASAVSVARQIGCQSERVIA